MQSDRSYKLVILHVHIIENIFVLISGPSVSNKLKSFLSVEPVEYVP